jgi:SAM-dependent methyltransferase
VTDNAETSTRADLNALNLWYEQPFGRALKARIAGKLTAILATIPARELLQLGVGGFEEILAGRQYELDVNDGEKPLAGRQRERMLFFTDIACEHLLSQNENTLPLQKESQDCVVLLHGLDVAFDPRGVLREVGRVTSKGGYVVIVGFNACSLWGAYRLLLRILKLRRLPPWKLHFYNIWRIRDWLELLDFEVGPVQTIGFQPVIQNPNIRRKISLLDTLGKLLLPRCGNVYVLTAKKITWPLTPVKLQWKRRYPIKAGAAEPSMRKIL